MVPRRPGKSASPIIFVAILALASIASATVAFSPYLFTYHNPGAIKIGASLSPSDAAENQTITVTVSDRNTLPNTVDELTLPAGGALGDNLSMGPRCGYLPFGIAVFQGRYGLDNISSGREMGYLFDPFAINGCGGVPDGSSFTFKPGQNMSASVQFRGYYAGDRSSDYVHPFPPGQYTVLAGDAWGHQLILHFTVILSSAAPPSASGLDLQINLGPSTIAQNSALSAQVSLFNPSDEGVSVAANFSNPNLPVWAQNDYECWGAVQDFMGFAVFPGHETASNFSLFSPIPLPLFPPVGESCPNPTAAESSARTVEFSPDSDLASFVGSTGASNPHGAYTAQLDVTTGACVGTKYSQQVATEGVYASTTTTTFLEDGWTCQDGDSLTGYWAFPLNGTYINPQTSASENMTQKMQTIQSQYFHEFPLGEYTIVAQDQWNDTAFAYFNVVAPSPLPVAVTVTWAGSSPGAETWDVTPTNIGQTPITSLSAVLGHFSQPATGENLSFRVSSQYPIPPGGTIYPAQFDIGGPIVAYPSNFLPYLTLTVSATLSTGALGGSPFSYVMEVWVTSP